MAERGVDAVLRQGTCRVKLGSFAGCLFCLLLLLVLGELSIVLFLEEVDTSPLVRSATPVGRDTPGQLLDHFVQPFSPIKWSIAKGRKLAQETP